MGAVAETAFVTGATGLLGNNLVRLLRKEGVKVKGLARSREKALRQFGGLDGVEIVEGNLEKVSAFKAALSGCDALFHTAAYFRESYQGGRHWSKLSRINIDGTKAILEAAREAGIRRFVHTSSIAVLDAPRGALINETMRRLESDGDEYYRSKILTDKAVDEFLRANPEMFGVFVLPGWMHGPGDLGPTAAGQFTLDYLQGKLPGVPPASFSFVDARDVAEVMVAALQSGLRGERYLAAGRHVHAADLMKAYERVTGIRAPRSRLPIPLLWLIAGLQELRARLTGAPALLSLASVWTMRREFERTHYDHAKTEIALRCRFRQIESTIQDEVSWFRAQGMI